MYCRDWFLSAYAYIPTARKWGLIIKDANRQPLKWVWFHPSLDSSREVLCSSINVLCARVLELNSGHMVCAMIRVFALSYPEFSWTEAYIYALNKEA